MTDSMYCEHDHLADACEVCAYAAAKKAGHPVPAQLHQPVTTADETPKKSTRGTTMRPKG